LKKKKKDEPRVETVGESLAKILGDDAEVIHDKLPVEVLAKPHTQLNIPALKAEVAKIKQEIMAVAAEEKTAREIEKVRQKKIKAATLLLMSD